MVRKYAGKTASIVPGVGPLESPFGKKEINVGLIPTGANETVTDAIDKKRKKDESRGKAFLRILRQRFTHTQYSSYSAPNGLIVYFQPDKPKKT